MTTTPVVSVTDELLAEIEALAGKATPGPWHVDSHGMTMMSMDKLEVVFQHPCDRKAVRHPETGNLSHWRNDWDASFIATANPATMLALTTELRRLRAITRVTMGVGEGSGQLFVHGDYESIKAAQRIVLENERLRSEIEALRMDAARYRWLRGGDRLMGESIDDHANNMCVCTADGEDVLWEEHLDTAIDTAMQSNTEGN